MAEGVNSVSFKSPDLTIRLSSSGALDYNKMSSQPSDTLSQYNNRLSEAPDSPVLNRTISSASTSTSATRRSSKVWDHTPAGKYDVIRNHKGKSIWQCRYCLKEYVESGGTAIIIGHLKEHGIILSST